MSMRLVRSWIMPSLAGKCAEMAVEIARYFGELVRDGQHPTIESSGRIVAIYIKA